MAMEQQWLGVNAAPLTQDGTTTGLITVADTAGYRVKGYAILVANSLSPLQVQVQRVISRTQMYVGPMGTTPNQANSVNISAYTVALQASVAFPQQFKNRLKPDDIDVFTYEGDPVNARRFVSVDPYGDFYTKDNPMPIVFDGTVEIGEVEIIGTNGNILEPNSNGSINVVEAAAPVPLTAQNPTNEISSVASGITTTILTYTVPTGKTASLNKIFASGENIGRYDVLLNGTRIDTNRTYWGSGFNTSFDFTTGFSQYNYLGYPLNTDDVVTVTILHVQPQLSQHEARFQIIEIG